SADKAQNGAAPAFTKLGNIVIQEVNTSDIAGGTLILTVPSGWRFGAGTGSVSFVAGRNITAASMSVAANIITVTLTVGGSPALDTLTISNIQVQAIEGGNLPAAGNILRTTANPGTASITGITPGAT